MFNPHQNININISYNLGSDKIPKQLPAKKIVKTQKAQITNPNHNCDI
jgi:glutamate synthase domain-containing protein 2